MDVHSKKIRSYNMSRIKSYNTKPEIYIRKLLHKNGYRYKLNSKINNIEPDVVLTKHKTCVFVHGCFWHSHANCKYNVIPKSNTNFWKEKLNKNKERDLRTIKTLNKNDWKTLIIWECTIKKKKISINDVKAFLKSKKKYQEI